MRNYILLIVLSTSLPVHAQIMYGTWRSNDGNTDYHHLVRSGGGAALYVNQTSSSSLHPILRLSSNTDAPNQNVRFTVENNGNVGIGTTTPSQKLEINGRTLANNFITQPNNSEYNQFIRSGNGAVVYINQVSTSSSAPILRLSSGTSTANQGIKFTVENNGDVGIGTTSPDSKLTVKGDIHAEEVKVDLSVPGPDYVFEPDYNLRTLEETEAYIQSNKHLPEIPSAKEMKANGVQLGEMNMLLLKKIEELTLHLIEQQKINKSLIQRIEKLETNN